MVVMKLGVKLSSLNRNRQQDLPTPESPINRSFIYMNNDVWLEGVQVVDLGEHEGKDGRGGVTWVGVPY